MCLWLLSKPKLPSHLFIATSRMLAPNLLSPSNSKPRTGQTLAEPLLRAQAQWAGWFFLPWAASHMFPTALVSQHLMTLLHLRPQPGTRAKPTLPLLCPKARVSRKQGPMFESLLPSFNPLGFRHLYLFIKHTRHDKKDHLTSV